MLHISDKLNILVSPLAIRKFEPTLRLKTKEVVSDSTWTEDVAIHGQGLNPLFASEAPQLMHTHIDGLAFTVLFFYVYKWTQIKPQGSP